MLIPNSPERALLDYAQFSADGTNPITSPGIKPLNLNINLDNQDCIDFVFKTVCREPWYKREEVEEVLLGKKDNVAVFLAYKGYFPASRLIEGGIVSYYDSTVNHWGIVHRGSIVSKFGKSEVYQHRADVAPIEYGDSIDCHAPSLAKRLIIIKTLDRMIGSSAIL